MRKEKSEWELYNRETSLYEKSDYRSKFYNGKWEKVWLKEVILKAVSQKLNLYDAMWSNYTDKIEHMPKSLFKFFPFNHNSIKCVETNNVFMNNPKNFNDPFDCVLCASEKEFLKQYLIRTGKDDYEEVVKKIEQGLIVKCEVIKNVTYFTQVRIIGYDNCVGSIHISELIAPYSDNNRPKNGMIFDAKVLNEKFNNRLQRNVWMLTMDTTNSRDNMEQYETEMAKALKKLNLE